MDTFIFRVGSNPLLRQLGKFAGVVVRVESLPVPVLWRRGVCAPS